MFVGVVLGAYIIYNLFKKWKKNTYTTD
jgi:hypothetical protein